MNAGALATLRTDFNSVDDNGLLTATNNGLGGFSSQLDNGAMVYVADGEGNSCVGWIVKRQGLLYYLRPEWSSWLSTELAAFTGQAIPSIPRICSEPESQTTPSGLAPATL